MQVKRYEVHSILEGMNRIKKDLGPEAIVLSTRKIKKGKVDLFEVMAARDESMQTLMVGDKPALPAERGGLNGAAKMDTIELIRHEFNEFKNLILAGQRQNSLAGELAEIRETISLFFDALGMRQRRMPQDVSTKLYLRLVGKGFSRAGACRIMDEVNRSWKKDAPAGEEEAISVAAIYIGNTLAAGEKNNEHSRVRMFVGPPGVGKTTTLAKLAARDAIMKKKNVGLITVDNFRLAAAEQLGAYARIMGLPLQTASTKESFAKALEAFSGKDVIYVDTPGRTRPDDGYLSRLQQALPNEAIQKNLLINATGNEEYLERVISGYEHLNIDNLIVTKIDESRRCGMLYDMIVRTKKPVRYVTFGQNVPQDIDEATPELIASLMLDGIMTPSGERPAQPVLARS